MSQGSDLRAKVAKPDRRPHVIARLDGRPNSIDVDATGVYVGLHAGAVLRIAHDGGEKTKIFSESTGARHSDLVVDETHIYWDNYQGIWRGAKKGGEVERLTSKAITRLRIAKGTLYWALDSGGDIYRSPATGGPASKLAHGQGSTFDLALDSKRVFWATSDSTAISKPSSSIYALPLEGNRPILLADNQARAIRIAVDGNSVYWRTLAGSMTGEIVTVAGDGGEPQVLASGQDRPNALAVVGDFVYWLNYGSNQGGGSLNRVRKTGGARETVVTGLGRPGRELIAHEGFLYWIEPPEGTVSRYRVTP